MNSNITFSRAGMWVPVTDSSYLSSSYKGELANTFHALISLGTSGQYGMVVTGWGYSGWPPTLTKTPPVSIAMLVPDSNGNLNIGTSAYISDPSTNGAGSAIVADFNGDGKPDIFLAAHNESPFLAMPSTAWLSNPSGGFTKVTLPDLVMAHDAELVYVNGKPTVITGSFTNNDSGTRIAGALSNPIYTFTNGAFVVSTPTNVSQLWGMDSTLVKNGANGTLELARGDVGNNWTSANGWDVSNINVYNFNGTDVTSTTAVQSIVPYLSTLPEYKNITSLSGLGLTHTYRLWADDVNHDGKQDILAGESMWSATSKDFPSALEVLINKGDGTFRGATATLNPDMQLNTSEMDYNPNFVDLDHSGINTYLFAGNTSWGSMARQSDYVLLNDGTGRLYVALHDQFTSLAQQVFSYLGVTSNATSTPPRFIGIPQTDGSLNFVAEIPTKVANASVNISQAAYQYVNVPLHYNPTNDFKTNVVVNDRNGSMLMRTWAGNDTIYDTNASSGATSIDGGIGLDTVVYSGKRSDYTITNSGSSIVIHANSSAKGDDTIVNIERLQFLDRSVALDISGNAGQVYRVYQAAFNRMPDNGGLKYWIGTMDGGGPLDLVTSGFVASAEFQTLYGTDPSSQQFVSKLYSNVLHRTSDQGGYDYWTGLLDHNQISKVVALAQFSESPENQAGVIGVIQNGIDLLN